LLQRSMDMSNLSFSSTLRSTTRAVFSAIADFAHRECRVQVTAPTKIAIQDKT